MHLHSAVIDLNTGLIIQKTQICVDSAFAFILSLIYLNDLYQAVTSFVKGVAGGVLFSCRYVDLFYVR